MRINVARRLKKKVKQSLKIGGIGTLAVFAMSMSLVTNINAEYSATIKSDDTMPVYKIKSGAETAKKTLLQEIANNSDSIDATAVNTEASTVDLTKMDINTKGMKVVNVNATVSAGEEQHEVNETAVVVVETNEYPTLKLKAEEITIANDGEEHYFLPEAYVTSIYDSSTGSLPALTFDGADQVDVKTDGYYAVTYKATNSNGFSTEKVLTVHVETPQWLIEQREAEAAEAQRQAEEEARIQAEKEEAERLQAEAQKQLEENEAITSGLQYSGGSNPYGGGWSNCTYGAWQALYNTRGISLPNLGNASEWYSNAAAAGYSVSDTPTAGGIAVYRGHVAYVDAVNGDSVHIVEGGFSGHYNERWVSIYGTGTKSTIGYINV